MESNVTARNAVVSGNLFFAQDEEWDVSKLKYSMIP